MIARKNIARMTKKALANPGYAWQAFHKRLRSAITYHLYDGRSAWPETISLFLTYKCNLRCYMCGQWGDAGAFKEFDNQVLRERLSKEEICAFIDDIAFFRPNITLFGGEPMLYKGWTEVVAHIKQQKMRCNMVTNGTLLEVYAEAIVKIGMDEIILSIDGPEEVHDHTRGAGGTFASIERGMRAIAEEKAKRRSRYPILNINCTITNDNHHNLEEILDVAEDLGVNGLNFHHLLFIDQNIYDQHDAIFNASFKQSTTDWKGFVCDQLPTIDSDVLIGQIHKVTDRDSPVSVTVYPNLPSDEVRDWYSGFEFTSKSYKNRYMSLWMAAWVFPDGQVRPYHTMNYSPGNIREQSFREIWNNDPYLSYRSEVKRRKRFPVCSKGCTELYRY